MEILISLETKREINQLVAWRWFSVRKLIKAVNMGIR